MGENRLEMAWRHVLEGRRIVERQRQRVARQHNQGRNTEYAEDLLRSFERSLALFENDLAAILGESRQTSADDSKRAAHVRN